MAYNIGDRAGDYEIIDVLGAGGMGKVYKVRNIISERVEAMKVLLPNLESDPDLADRFMREIKVQASLQHQNIAALHTAQRLNNSLVMLIEFVEGITLEAALRKGPIPPEKAIDYIKQVLQALAYAHSHGVIHRDIKPANMMLTPSGVVKLMDFGIAKLSEDRRLTQTGRTVGSLYYMSPEQIQGAVDLDPRADLYSLGVAFYELLTRTRPFQGDSDYSIMAAHLNAQPVPPIQIDPSIPPVLSDIILMAIAKSPDQRFQTADAFRRALDSVSAQFKSGGSITKVVGGAIPPQRPVTPPPIVPTPPQQQSSSRRGLYMALGSLVAVVVIVAIAMVGPKLFKGPAASSIPPTQTVTTTPTTSQPTSTPTVTQPADPVTTTQPQVTTTTSPSYPDPSKKNLNARPPQTTTAQQTTPAYNPPQQTPVTPQQQTQVTPQQTPAVDQANVAALREARELLTMLGSRANSARSTLSRMKQEQARQGLGMRGDILTAEQRMEAFLDDAQAAIRSGDHEGAKKYLSQAEREIDKIDSFLGR